MLRTVVASRFIRMVVAGRNKPLLLADDQGTEYVAKFSSCECGHIGLVREALAGMLASDLGLPVTEPVTIELVKGFVEALPESEVEAIGIIQRSQLPGFGSTLLPPGFSVVMNGYRIEERLVNQAAEILAFDALVLNADRRPINPNCQTNGNTFAMYDHDLTLVTAGVGSEWNPAPWQTGALHGLKHGEGEHLLFKSLKGRNASVDRLEARWSELSAGRLDEYVAALPESWALRAVDVIFDVVRYLNDLSQNLSAAFGEVRRVLA